jgi:hypothetical protein
MDRPTYELWTVLDPSYVALCHPEQQLPEVPNQSIRVATIRRLLPKGTCCIKVPEANHELAIQPASCWTIAISCTFSFASFHGNVSTSPTFALTFNLENI